MCLSSGDDVLNRPATGKKSRFAHRPDDESGFWPGGVVYYEFGRGFSSNTTRKNLVYATMQAIMSKTCVRFEPWNGSPGTEIPIDTVCCYFSHNYMLFTLIKSYCMSKLKRVRIYSYQ